jgi:hypothetical protein
MRSRPGLSLVIISPVIMLGAAGIMGGLVALTFTVPMLAIVTVPALLTGILGLAELSDRLRPHAILRRAHAVERVDEETASTQITRRAA